MLKRFIVFVRWSKFSRACDEVIEILTRICPTLPYWAAPNFSGLLLDSIGKLTLKETVRKITKTLSFSEKNKNTENMVLPYGNVWQSRVIQTWNMSHWNENAFPESWHDETRRFLRKKYKKNHDSMKGLSLLSANWQKKR